MRAGKRLWRTADSKGLVEDGHPDAALLAYAADDQVTEADRKLVGEAPAEPEPEADPDDDGQDDPDSEEEPEPEPEKVEAPAPAKKPARRTRGKGKPADGSRW